MTTNKLTELQERVARIAAAFPGISKTEIARRAHCSRRAVVTHFKNPAFIERMKNLKAELEVNIYDITDSMDRKKKAELLKELKQKRGTYLPDLEELEAEFNDIELDVAGLDLIDSTTNDLSQLASEFIGPEITSEELCKMISERENILISAGVDISPSNPELIVPGIEEYFTDLGISESDLNTDTSDNSHCSDGCEETL